MIAKGFIEAGANVLLTSRDEKACAEAAASLNSPNVHFVASNVSSRDGCVALAEHTASVFDNKLDVLVNNAGTSIQKYKERITAFSVFILLFSFLMPEILLCFNF